MSGLFPPYRRWYRFGLRSPSVLYGRLRNRFRPVLALRTAYQRVRYGISDQDAWGLDYFLATTTVRGIQKLRAWKHGHPMELTPEEWDDILARIQDGFQVWLDADGTFMDAADRRRFDEGIELYGKWFSALWD